MKLMKKVLAFTLCLCCILSLCGCSIIGAGVLAGSNDEMANALPEYDKEDAEAVKDLVGDIADIAADTYKEHFGEIDIGEIAENVDRNKVAEFMDNAAVFLKEGFAFISEVWSETNEQTSEPTENTTP